MNFPRTNPDCSIMPCTSRNELSAAFCSSVRQTRVRELKTQGLEASRETGAEPSTGTAHDCRAAFQDENSLAHESPL